MLLVARSFIQSYNYNIIILLSNPFKWPSNPKTLPLIEAVICLPLMRGCTTNILYSIMGLVNMIFNYVLSKNL